MAGIFPVENECGCCRLEGTAAEAVSDVFFCSDGGLEGDEWEEGKEHSEGLSGDAESWLLVPPDCPVKNDCVTKHEVKAHYL